MAGSLEEAKGWISLAEQTTDAARALLDQGFLRDAMRDAMSRAYYAMFCATKAALAFDGIDAHKHSSVISAFGREFARTGRLSHDLHRQLVEAFDDRGVADYRQTWLFCREAVERRVAEADGFVAQVEALAHAS